MPYATDATVHIMDRMLHNSVSVMCAMERERGIADYPLYHHEDVDYAVDCTSGKPFDLDFPLDEAGEVRARFYRAGHVLGSASVLLRMRGHTVFYTGDICAADQELMAGLCPLEESEAVDTLIIESTYGANEAAQNIQFEQEVARFAAAICQVLERGGSVLVPSFALGRTQEMLNIIGRLQDAGTIPAVPVFASGLGRSIYEVYNRFHEYLHPSANLRPLSRFGRVGDVWSPEVVRGLLREPAILVATSGMMVENTPSALIAEAMVRDKRHGIFFAGYLDPDTLGYKLCHAGPGASMPFGINRAPVKIVLDNIQTFHFSAHASREALREVVERARPRNVVFVHGDPEAIDWMYRESGNGCRKFTTPIGETITLEA
jgi:Cft2 family RNA processing exonuclease